MKKSIVFPFVCLLAANTVFAQDKTAQNKIAQGLAVKPLTLGKTVNGWTEVSNGILIRIWKDAKGPNAKVGDFITIHTRARVGDSILFSSRQVNNNEPFELQIRPGEQPRFDLIETFQLLSEGDSATLRTPLDTIIKNGAPEAEWMKKRNIVKKGKKPAVWWFDQDVVVVKQKDQAEAFKEKTAKSKAQMEIDESSMKDYFKQNNIAAIKHPSGLYYKIDEAGTGDTAKAGQKILIQYTGKTMDGKVFDSNTDPAFNHVQPYEFTLGQGQVISGWDIGVSLLKKGTKATLYIPSGLAYGERSPSSAIPPNSVLIFDVMLIDVKNAESAPAHGAHDGHNH